MLGFSGYSAGCGVASAPKQCDCSLSHYAFSSAKD